MKDRTYTDLFSLITALAGVSNFTTQEQTHILNFVNRRAYEAYKLSQAWARFLVVGEERTLSSQFVPYTELGKDNIQEFIRIHRKKPFVNYSREEYQFYVDSNGANILNISNTSDTTVFVTYKKEFSVYNTSSTDVPEEWFYFLAHAVYSDFLKMDGQNEKSQIEEASANKYLASEMEDVNVISNNNTIFGKISTHNTRQAR